MEKMPYREQLERLATNTDGASWQAATSDWRSGLPLLSGQLVTLRDLRVSDAPSLLRTLPPEEVRKFVAPPPTTVDGFANFILWAHAQRARGTYLCFGVVPEGHDDAIGLFQVCELEPGFGTAEWGFALGSRFWGTGVFEESARLVADFVFDVIGSHRLEARAAAADGRGNGALKKIGAEQEGVLRKSLFGDGIYLDQLLWTILDENWRACRARQPAPVH